MNGRLYDPDLHRFLMPDNFVQDPFSTQSFNRYAYCLNNPLMYVDENGEFPWIPVIIGIALGAYSGGVIANNGEYNLFKWDYQNSNTWSYMFGGAVVGGLSGYAGAFIASSQIPMSSTLSIMASSSINSLGTWVYTGGKTDISISFGVASYNFSKGSFGYLGKSGNSSLENIGYGLGALANLNDAWNTFFPDQQGTNLYTDGDDPIISHTAYGDNTVNGIISFGPDKQNPFFYQRWKALGYEKLSFGNEMVGNIKGYAKFGLGLPGKGTYWAYSDYNNFTINISNINKIPLSLVGKMSHALPYQGLTLNCVNIGSLGAFLSGIPNIGIHPWLHHASMWFYEATRYDIFLHNLLITK